MINIIISNYFRMLFFIIILTNNCYGFIGLGYAGYVLKSPFAISLSVINYLVSSKSTEETDPTRVITINDPLIDKNGALTDGGKQFLIGLKRIHQDCTWIEVNNDSVSSHPIYAYNEEKDKLLKQKARILPLEYHNLIDALKPFDDRATCRVKRLAYYTGETIVTVAILGLAAYGGYKITEKFFVDDNN